ncbi:MAG TPA: TolC family protein [Gemmatimonadaceae bacterium]|jgi:outer membrane protein TolC|nr:TolC family protein [Gemmatimonadaceae bacterium]
MRLATLPFALAALVSAATARAQQTGAEPRDTLRLADAQSRAVASDPRRRQLELQERATALGLQSLSAERLPALSAGGQAQYQSAVTRVSVALPGVTIPSPSQDTYDARLNVQQSIFDPTYRPRAAVERARLVESQAQVRTSLYGLRQDVNEAFFAALMAQEKVAQVEATIAALSARLGETETRRREGAATPGDTAAIAAALLQRRQDLAQIEADRTAALARLSDLIGTTVSRATVLAAPVLDTAVARALPRAIDSVRARPEYAQFAAARERLARQEAVEGAQDKPRVSAFGRAGYGRPGLNMLSTDFQSYWLAGVQLQWAPWTWGTTTRDREVIEVQREIVASNEAAFTASLRRAVQQSLATMRRLDTTLALDERIITLREQVERETSARLRESVVTAAEYTDRAADLLAARLTHAQHRVELAQARATFLTIIGVDAP